MNDLVRVLQNGMQMEIGEVTKMYGNEGTANNLSFRGNVLMEEMRMKQKAGKELKLKGKQTTEKEYRDVN